ncbi:MAG: V-type ATP synthase subunit I [candidate division WOR-3 bacterium]
MAIAPLNKVLIATHKSEEKYLIAQLQELGILHIIQKTEAQENVYKTTAQEKLSEISSVIEYLTSFSEKSGILTGLVSTKTEVTTEEYNRIAQKYDSDAIINKINQNRQKLLQFINQKKNIEAELALLVPWQNLKYDLADIYQAKTTEIILGQFQSNDFYLQVQNELKDLPAYIEVVHQEKDTLYVLIAYPKLIKETIKPHLAKLEIVDLSKYQGKPKDIIDDRLKQLNMLDMDIENVKQEIIKLSPELPKLQVLHDYYYNLSSQEAISPALMTTNQVVFINGWIKQKDVKKLEQLIKSCKTAVMTLLAITEGEEIPVALENRKIFRPFEIILDLYTMPQPNEIDPTPLLAPFFAIFFALCLTDAGYGIILLALSLFLLKKLKAADKFLKLLAICGGFTILAGAITGGWFGDIVDKIGLQFLVKFRDQLLLFDPIKNPMPFFIISIALGYLHLNYGIIIEIYDSFRQKYWQGAIFEQLPWFLFLNSLIIYAFIPRYFPIAIKPYLILTILIATAIIIAFTRRNQKLMLNQVCWSMTFLGGLMLLATKIKLLPLPTYQSSWLVAKIIFFSGLFSLLAISLRAQLVNKKFNVLSIVFLIGLVATFIGYEFFKLSLMPFILFTLLLIMLAEENRKLIKNIIWGLYNLYGGTSFLGVVLSYIRLMALGMVTAGIAMAINTIAWMLIKIPVIGIILAIIMLIFGHTYNLLINILGAFVHSLRLNYVEFFPRFFTGGGDKFTPFQRQTKYVTIK